MKEIYDPTEVDIYNLHEEWKIQANLRRKAGDEQSEIGKQLRNKKAYAKFRRAQIAMEYRKGVLDARDKDDKVIKLTEKATADILDSDEELYTIDKEINALQYDHDIAQSYCNALDVKKYALQDEVRLFLAGYFAEPTDPSRGKQYEAKVKEVQRDIEESEQAEKTKVRRRARREVKDV